MEKTCSKCQKNPPYNSYSRQCLECKKQYNYKWRKKTGITKSDKKRALNYYHSNKDRIIEYSKKYIQEHHEKVKKYQKNSYEKRKWNRIYSLIHNTLKSKGLNKVTKSSILLGYTAKELKEHLNKQSEDWNNKHIDHKIPISWFKDNTPLSIICHLENLHLVDKKYNLEKQDKWCNIPNKEYLELAKPYLIGYEIKR